ncbi:MAG: metallophosphoesterase [Blastopirellula sp.]|nr:MAG: metallophosphoesterase [Blastopirellula sp.]
MKTTLALFGGIYNNYLALEAAIVDEKKRGASDIYCLGDLGAFGPHPDRVFPLLQENNIQCVQGNYDDSIGNELENCQCGYTDPRDNYFAQISYDYTLANTSVPNRHYLKNLPKEIRLEIQGKRVLLCHGSPRKTNEFLWESTTSTHFLERLASDFEADVLVGTHSGIHWQRSLSGGRAFINVGVLGRPENDGRTDVWYTLLHFNDAQEVEVEFVPLRYDHQRMAAEMTEQQLPQEFIDTITTGWWSTCLEILPAKERARGKF